MQELPSKEQALHAHGVGRLDHVQLDLQIAHQKADRIGAVGENAADPGRGQEHHLGTLLLKETAGGHAVLQIQLGVIAHDDVAVSLRRQMARDRPHPPARD